MGKKILVACEESQIVTMAFRELGYEAYSCDIQDCGGGYPQYHIKGDALVEAYSGKYKLMIGHPPCTYLSFAGNSSWNNPGRVFDRLKALEFFAKLWTAPIERICLENPKSVASPVIAKYDQEIQPYYFGDPHQKTTWLWLKNLPHLVYSRQETLFDEKSAVNKPEALAVDNTETGMKRHYADFHRDPKERSKTFPGIARAMAQQWSKLL